MKYKGKEPTIEEIKEYLEKRKDIKESLDRYFGFMHANINLLGSLNLKKIINMEAKGWHIMSSKEDINRLIEDFINIYGFIYKYGDTQRSKIIRGTTTDEIREINKKKEVGEILSTTTKEDVAKTFCEYGKAALIRIRTNGVPSIYVEDLKDEDSKDESEVLVLPFSRITEITDSGEYNGYKYYDMTLEKGKLPDVSDEQLQEFRQEAINGYKEFIEKQKEFDDIIDNKYGQSDHTVEQKEEVYQRLNTIHKEILTYQENFLGMLKGFCRQREKEIDLEKQNEETMIQEKRQMAEKSRLSKLAEEIFNLKTDIDNYANTIKQDTKLGVENFINLVRKYRKISDALGIKTFNSKKLEPNVQARQEKIESELDKELDSDENLDVECEKLVEREKNFREANQLIKKMSNFLKNYDQYSLYELKVNLNEKVQKMIFDMKYNCLIKQKEELLTEKDSFLSKISGKNAIKDARIENIDARIRYFERERQAANPENNVKEMIMEMYECALNYNGGKLTPEMGKLEKVMRIVFTNIPDRKTLLQNIMSMQISGLPAVQIKDGFFKAGIKHSKELRRLKQETIEINEKANNMQIPVRKNENVARIYIKLNSILENVYQRVKVDDSKQQQQIGNIGKEAGEQQKY